MKLMKKSLISTLVLVALGSGVVTSVEANKHEYDYHHAQPNSQKTEDNSSDGKWTWSTLNASYNTVEKITQTANDTTLNVRQKLTKIGEAVNAYNHVKAASDKLNKSHAYTRSLEGRQGDSKTFEDVSEEKIAQSEGKGHNESDTAQVLALFNLKYEQANKQLADAQKSGDSLKIKQANNYVGATKADLDNARLFEASRNEHYKSLKK